MESKKLRIEPPKPSIEIRRGDVFVANLGLTVGCEICMTRPVVVVSADNSDNGVTTVIPLTTNVDRLYSHEVPIPAGEGNLRENCKAKCNHVKSIDAKKFGPKIGSLTPETMLHIDDALTRHMGIQGRSIRTGVALLLLRDGPGGTEVLMGKRISKNGNGKWAPPGGYVEFGETGVVAARRELKEETGVDVPGDLVGLGYAETIYPDHHYVTQFFGVVVQDVIPLLTEPRACEGWEWFHTGNLPEPLFRPMRGFVEGHPGWDEKFHR